MERVALSLSRRLNRRMFLLMLTLLLISVLLYGQLRWQNLKGLVGGSLENVAQDIQRVYVDLMLVDGALSRSSASSYLMKLYNEPYTIDLMNIAGERIASTQEGMGFPAAINNEPGHHVFWYEKKLYHVYVAVLSNNSGARIGHAILTTDITGQLEIIGVELLWITFGIFIFSSMVYAVLHWFTRDVVSRIEGLKHLSQAYSLRDFKQVAPVEPYDELGQLGEMMNFMGQHWQEHHRTRQEGFSRMAHDFRTPLTVVLTWADYLLENPSELAEGIEIIKGEAIKLKHMAHSYLESQYGDEQHIVAVGDLGKLVTHEMDKLLLGLNRSNIQVQMQIENLVMAFDAYRMTQVLFNLVDNSMKHGQKKGHSYLGVKLSKIDDHVVMAIVDAVDQERLEAGLNFAFNKEIQRREDCEPIHFVESVGMKSIKHGVALHGGRVCWWHQGGWTLARIELPLR